MGGIETAALMAALPALGSAAGGTLSTLLPAGVTSAATTALPALTSFLQPAQFPAGALNEIIKTGASSALPDLSKVAFEAIPMEGGAALGLGQDIGSTLLGAGKNVAGNAVQGVAQQGLANLISPPSRAPAQAPEIPAFPPVAPFPLSDRALAEEEMMNQRLQSALNRYI